MDILGIAVIGLITVLLAIQLKSVRPEYGTYLSMAGMLMIAVYSVGKLSGIMALLEKMTSYVNIHENYITVLLKIIGITYIAEFSADICRDAGHAAVGNQIEIFGKLRVMAVSMPILLALLETIDGFFQ